MEPRLEVDRLPGRGARRDAALSRSTSRASGPRSCSPTRRSTPGSPCRQQRRSSTRRRGIAEPAELFVADLPATRPRRRAAHARERRHSPKKSTCGRSSGCGSPARWLEDRRLHRQAARVRSEPEIPARPQRPRRAAGSVARRVPRRLSAGPRAPDTSPPSRTRTGRSARTGLHGADLGRLGGAGLRGSDEGHRRAREAALRRREPHGRDGVVVSAAT